MPYLKPDDTTVASKEILDLGLNGILLQRGQNVLKIPKIWSTSTLVGEDLEIVEHSNNTNRESHEVEKQVYLRVWPHKGLVDRLEISEDGIFLQYLPNGNLEAHIASQAEPTRSDKVEGIRRIISTVLHIHRKKVLLYDIATRNVLIADDGSLRMIDFGQCSILPEAIDMSTADDNGCTVRSDIFHLGCVIYSTAMWTKFEFDLFGRQFKFPRLDNLPSVDGVFCGKVIQKCWGGIYSNVEELEKDWSELKT